VFPISSNARVGGSNATAEAEASPNSPDTTRATSPDLSRRASSGAVPPRMSDVFVARQIQAAIQDNDDVRLHNLVARARLRQGAVSTDQALQLFEQALREGRSDAVKASLASLPGLDHGMAERIVEGPKVVAKLYRNGLPRGATELDRALFNCNFAEAHRLLDDERDASMSDKDLWVSSVGPLSGQGEARPDREDIRRAMLVLCDSKAIGPNTMSSVMHLHGFKLNSKPTEDLLKSIPYFSPKYKVTTDDPSYRKKHPLHQRMAKELGGLPLNNNDRFDFPGGGKKIVCQEITAEWSDGLDDKGKFDYRKFETREAMQANVSESRTENVRNRLLLAPNRKLMYDIDYGKNLANEFRAMERDGINLKVLEPATGGHLMGTALRIKRKAEDGFQTKYVVKPFDPDISAGIKRVASIDDLGTIEKLSFTDLQPTPTFGLTRFLGEDSAIVAPADKPQAGWNADAQVVIDDTGRRLAGPWTRPISTTLLSRLMMFGMEGELKQMEGRILEHIATLSRQGAMTFLTARDPYERTAAQRCLQMGNGATMRWYCKFLEKMNLDRDEAKALLDISGQDTMLRTLQLAPRMRDATRAYLECGVPLLHPDEQVAQLTTRNAFNRPDVMLSFTTMDDDFLDAYVQCARQAGLSDDAKRSLLLQAGNPYMPDVPYASILEVQHPGAAAAFGELVSALGMEHDPEVRALLDDVDSVRLSADDGQAIDALCDAIESSGERIARAQRQVLIHDLSRAFQDDDRPLDPQVVLAIRANTFDVIAVSRMLAENSLEKYQRFPERQGALVQALIAFNDPGTTLSRNGDHGYDYDIDTQAHGTCRVSFEFEQNEVTTLRVKRADGGTVACMRPSAWEDIGFDSPDAMSP
jgi:hypothetical protein